MLQTLSFEDFSFYGSGFLLLRLITYYAIPLGTFVCTENTYSTTTTVIHVDVSLPTLALAFPFDTYSLSKNNGREKNCELCI